MITKKVQIGETAATITCERQYLKHVIAGISSARSELKEYIRTNPEFLYTMEPLKINDDAPELVRRMCIAAMKAGVGPMATVAGAIANAGVEHAAVKGARHCIVDNGGDISMILKETVKIGILCELESDRMPTVELSETDGEIVGLCTSSGTLGHSISYGRASASTIMARDPLLADALATAVGNRCIDSLSIQTALKPLQELKEVLWGIVMVDGCVGMVGDVPELLYRRKGAKSITVHSEFPAVISMRES